MIAAPIGSQVLKYTYVCKTQSTKNNTNVNAMWLNSTPVTRTVLARYGRKA